MTAPNYHGWTESEERAQMRAERRKAKQIAFEVWQASQLTPEEETALFAAIDMVSGIDPLASVEHLLTAAEQTAASYGTLDLSQDPTVQRLNNAAGYDVFTALATKSPERVQWERDYLERRRRQSR